MKKLTFTILSTLILVSTAYLPKGFAQETFEYRTLAGHTSWVSNVSFSPDGSLLASGTGSAEDGTILLWELAPVVDDYSDTREGATPLTLGSSIEGSAFSADVDYFSVEVNSTGTLNLFYEGGDFAKNIETAQGRL